MSIRIMAQVWEREFSRSEQAIMLALADHAHDDGSRVFPSVARTSWKTGYSKRQVQRIIGALKKSGVLIVVKKAYKNRPTEYRIDLLKAPEKPAYRGDTTSPLYAGVTGEVNGGDIPDARGDIALSPEPSLEPPDQLKEKGATPAPLAVETYRSKARRYPDKATWGKISEAVGESEDDLTFWGEVVEGYILCGWNKINIDGMLKYYYRRTLPTTGRQSSTAPHIDDAVFDALMSAANYASGNLTDRARGEVDATAKDLREVDATPDQIARFPAWYRQNIIDNAPSIAGFSKYWPRYLKAVRPPEPPPLPPKIDGAMTPSDDQAVRDAMYAAYKQPPPDREPVRNGERPMADAVADLAARTRGKT